MFKRQADENICVQLGKVPHILDHKVTRLTGYFQFLSSLLPPSFDRRPSVALDMKKGKIPNCPVNESTFWFPVCGESMYCI